MNDYELEDKIKRLEVYYNYEGESVSSQLIEDIISTINYLEEEIEALERQSPYY